jgi:hypothetical protein
MKSYNHALDYLALAGEQFGKGRLKVAAKCLARAVKMPDFPQAIEIIEANNSAAFVAAQVAAKTKTTKSTAKSRVLSAEDAALESLVGDLDELDEDADAEEMDEDADEDEEVEAGADPEGGEPEEVEDEAIEDEDEDEGAAFAAVLASMKKTKKPATATARKPARK